MHDYISPAKKRDIGYPTCVLGVILFVMCLVMFYDSVSKFQAIGLAQNELDGSDIPYFQTHYYQYIPIILSGLFGLLGCYGALTVNVTILRFFIYAILIISLINGYVVYFTIKCGTMNNFGRDVINKLETYGHNYQYNLTPAQEPNKATRVWDQIQSVLHCCGLKGPEDWPKWRRSNGTYEQDLYPDSCCMSLPRISSAMDPIEGKCHEDMTFKSGCLQTFRTTTLMRGVYLCCDVAVRTIMAIVAMMMVKSVKVEPSQLLSGHAYSVM